MLTPLHLHSHATGSSCIPCDLTNFNVGDQVDPVIILFFPYVNETSIIDEFIQPLSAKLRTPCIVESEIKNISVFKN